MCLAFAAAGTFNKSGAGTATNVSTIFDNAGTVNVDSGTLRLSGGGAEKALDSGGSPRVAGAEALKSTFWGMAPAVGTQKPEPWAKKMEKNSLGVRHGGARCYNRRQTEPGSVQGSAHLGNVG